MKSRRPRGRITIDSRRCKGCGLCIWACPKSEIALKDEVDSRGMRVAQICEKDACTGCTFCAIVCPDVAITVYRDGSSAS